MQQRVKAEADETEKEQWREGVNDLWENKLSHLREEITGPFVYDPQTRRYGFQEGLEYDSEEELMDDLINEVEGENHTPKGDGEESVSHHVASVSSNQEFSNDGAFVYDRQCGFQEGLDYDSEEATLKDFIKSLSCWVANIYMYSDMFHSLFLLSLSSCLRHTNFRAKCTRLYS